MRRNVILRFIIGFLLLAAVLGAVSSFGKKIGQVPDEPSAGIASEASASCREQTEETIVSAGPSNTAEESGEKFLIVPDANETSSQSEGAVAIGSDSTDAPFSMTMLDVGQGLSLLFQCDGKYMLYDGGGRDRSSYVVAFLEEHGISDIDLMIASHYDEDHVAGLIGVLKTMTVQTVVDPDYSADSNIYDSFITAQSDSGAAVIHPKTGDRFTLGRADIEVIWEDPSAEIENDRSIVIRVTYGDTSILITGDAEENGEAVVLASGLDIDSDVYVAGHHGSRYSSSNELLSAVDPAYTFISCGRGNDYGFPTEDTLDRLRDVGSQLFRSDVQGEVTMYSNGNEYWFSQEPTDDWTPGAPAETDSSQEADEASEITDEHGTYRYVLNTHSMRFHRPDCPSVSQISDRNIQYSDETREEIISEGYQPCGYCDP
ncbi:MAG TPA: hypothetical protein DEP00_03990 [Lachnospiraceae bacterium]|nr:hypothetical protein [Lachnospiraceae bacterium]